MKNFFLIVAVILCVSTIFVFSSGQYEKVLEIATIAGRNIASVFFVESITVSGLQGTYTNASSLRKVNILIVPGHEPDNGGTEYKKLKERDMTVELADDLAKYLKTNSHYNVTVSRDRDAWNPSLKDYFDKNWDEIVKFSKDQKTVMNQLVNDGKILKAVDGVYHNSVPTNMALRMYGINKWANENKIDITINIHINDYPRKNTNKPGEYSGFSIYIPDFQYSNAKTSAFIAEKIFKQLATFLPVSNLPKENAGIIPDQDLIAIGAYNTNDSASVLIEYGYIYDDWFQFENTRPVIINKMAYSTYLGIQDFFGAYSNATLSLK